MKFAHIFASVVLASVASVANAGLVSIVPVAQDAVPGTVTTDIIIDSQGSTILSQQLRLLLSSGSIYQDAVGGNTPPNPAFFPLAPTVEFDTYLGGGGRTSADGPAPLVFGRSDSLGGPGGTPADFSEQLIDATYSAAAGENTNRNDYFSARITLSEDANGTFQFLADFGDQSRQLVELDVINGVIGIPEPASFALAGLAMVGLAGIRRRK